MRSHHKPFWIVCTAHKSGSVDVSGRLTWSTRCESMRMVVGRGWPAQYESSKQQMEWQVYSPPGHQSAVHSPVNRSAVRYITVAYLLQAFQRSPVVAPSTSFSTSISPWSELYSCHENRGTARVQGSVPTQNLASALL